MGKLKEYIYNFEFSHSGFPRWEDKRAGISKIFVSFFTLFLYIFTLLLTKKNYLPGTFSWSSLRHLMWSLVEPIPIPEATINGNEKSADNMLKTSMEITLKNTRIFNQHCRMRDKSSMFLSAIYKNLIFLSSFYC